MPPASGQDVDEDDDLLQDEVIEEIVVTGSRIRRNEFNSPSPIQVISGDVSRELGLFDAGEILQTTPQASGLQIDNTFGGFVLDNGPGGVTIGLRGLDTGRTLVMLNGRRIAPAGVGGAPVSPDLDLIPSAMVNRYEVLLDGASPVYGSDAIAGVVNVILRSDVEGFILESSVSDPNSGGGDVRRLSAMWGNTSDNGYFQIGAEYNDRTQQSVKDNPFMGDCEEYIYQTDNGQIIRGRRDLGPTIGGITANCMLNPFANYITGARFWGLLFHTPGYTNTGIPNYTESYVNPDFVGFLPTWVLADTNYDGEPNFGIVDGNGDGYLDVDYQDPFYNFQRTPYALGGDFVAPVNRLNLLTTGEYTFPNTNDTTVFGEFRYSERSNDFFQPGLQMFETVPANNPYNPCNPNGINGVDCFSVLGQAPIGPQAIQPVVIIRGDRDYSDVDIYQWSAVAGIRGGISGSWIYDAYVSESYSKGTESRPGISEPRLLWSLYTSSQNADGSVSCPRYTGHDGIFPGVGVDPDTRVDCVPVNLFADAVFGHGGGQLTPQEEAYLFVERYTETEITQRVFNAFVSGDLFSLPWNDALVPAVFGIEYREDEIASNPNQAASEGLLWGFFSDKGADGSRDLKEAFAEIELPLLRGVKYADELTVTAAWRWTEESFYDPATTYAVQSLYRPNSWLTIRGTYGTSYRAPNLRERFLNGTTGFLNLSDPCVVPNAARDGDPTDPAAPQTYNAGNDERLERVLVACRSQGVDPTALGLTGENGPFTSVYSMERVTGGTEHLQEEESISSTYGFVIEQPFWDSFDLRFSVTQFDIEITNAVTEPGGAYTLFSCYTEADYEPGESPFCTRITRDRESGRIILLNGTPINIGKETSKGVDINLLYQQDFEVGDRNLGVTFDFDASRYQEQFFNLLGTSDNNVQEPDVPKWLANASLAFQYGLWRFTWSARYIDAGREDIANDFDDYVPCDGLGIQCRPVYFTDDYDIHTAVLGWSDGQYQVELGMRNVFNTGPSLVDSGGVFSVRNYPIGAGYDPFGRTLYLNMSATF